MKNAEGAIGTATGFVMPLAVSGASGATTATKSGFVKAPRNLLYNADISDQALRLYLILEDYGRSGECFPSQQLLANDIGRDVRTVRRILVELQDAGLVDILGRIKYRSNSYALADTSSSIGSHQQHSDESIRSNGMDSSDKVKVFKEVLNTVCEEPPNTKKLSSEPNQLSSLVVPTEPTEPTEPTPNEIAIGEITNLYKAAGVFEDKARHLAAIKPDKVYAQALIASSQKEKIANPAAWIYFFGSSGELPGDTKPRNKKQASSVSLPTQQQERTYAVAKEFIAAGAAADVVGDIVTSEEVVEAKTKRSPEADTIARDLVKRLDRAAVGALRQARIEGDTLFVAFYNVAQKPNVRAWLPQLRVQGIRQVQELKL